MVLLGGCLGVVFCLWVYSLATANCLLLTANELKRPPPAAWGWCTAKLPFPARSLPEFSSSRPLSAPPCGLWTNLHQAASWVLYSLPRPVERWRDNTKRYGLINGQVSIGAQRQAFTCWNCAGIGLAYGTFFCGTFLVSLPMTSSMPQSRPGMDISTSGATSLPGDNSYTWVTPDNRVEPF